MHVLTKVFIVFAAVLSLVLAALTMAYSVNADAIVSNYSSAQRAAAAAEAAKQAAVAEASDKRAADQRTIADLQAIVSDLSSRNASLVTANSTLTAQVQQERNRADSIENQIGDSLETTEAQAKVIDSLITELNAARQSEVAQRRRALDLEDRVNDLASQNDVFGATIRSLREQLASAQRAAEMATVGGTETNTPYEASGAVIRGSVTQVSTDTASGQPLVQVDIGSNDRVAENMKLYVGRDNGFVATLVVVRTDLQSAVARVDLTNEGRMVRAGDMVVSRFQ